jgi:hypothetical protein
MTPTTRESEVHPYFPQPLDRNVRVWRYFKWRQFLDSVRNGYLWFSRTDLLDDPAEGSRTAGDAEMVERARKQLKAEGRHREATYARIDFRSMDEYARRSIFVSCWQMHDHDMVPMWERYCKPRQTGVAIQTTYARLDAALPLRHEQRHVMLGLVTYGDYSSLDFRSDLTNVYSSFMSKKVNYSEEREVRVICDGDFQVEQKGLRIPIDYPALVERVLVSPYSGPSFVTRVQRFCTQHRIGGAVLRSSAREVIRLY